MPTDSPPPPFEHVRLATVEDLPRIAVVAAAGFFLSPVFKFQRPYFADFPEDTVASYLKEYEKTLYDPASILIIAEDFHEEAENAFVYEALRSSTLLTSSAVSGSNKVIVGVCSIGLKPGSWRVGQFHSERHVKPFADDTVSPIQSRDVCARAADYYARVTAPAKTRYLAGHMRLSTLAVHPAYARRGHATRLVSWCTRLADLDETSIGVSAAPMGVGIVRAAGFEEYDKVEIKSSDLYRHSSSVPRLDNAERAACEDFVLWVGMRKPSGSASESSTASAGSPTEPLSPRDATSWLSQPKCFRR